MSNNPSVEYDPTCVKHFTSGCKPSKNTDAATKCMTCLSNNVDNWLKTVDKSSSSYKKIAAEYGQDPPDIPKALSFMTNAGLYCSGAESKDSVPTWAIIVFICVLVLLGIGLIYAGIKHFDKRRDLPSNVGGMLGHPRGRQRGG